MANDIIDIVVTDNSDNVQLNVTPNLVSINVSQTSGNIIGSNYFLASTFSALPITGDTTTLYVINDTSLMYRWSGSAYTQINSSAVVAWGQITGTLSGQTDLQNALNAKAPLASPTFTGTVSGITKLMVGLSNVDNTSDVNKPVSTATQNALDLKAPIASPTFTGTVSGVTKAMVGLGNVDNTSDVNKPISSATQTALDTKAPLASPTFTGTVSGITKSMVGLGNVDNTTDLNKPISTATQTALNLKYDASNPSGYTTNVGTVTSVGGTGTVSGLSLSGTVTTNGNLTLGGTLSLTSGNVTTALGYTPENAANKGVANGYASLDGGGLVPSTQLPSYVDDVLEFANLAAFPASGATGKIYVALDTNKIYRWSGATYIEVSPTVGTIWGGITGTLSNQTDLQNALNAKQDDITLTTTGTSGAATFISNTLNIPNYAPDLSGYVPYTGATTNVNLGTHSLTASDLVINHVSGSGVAASITKGGSGEALTVVKTSGSGNAASITGGVTLLDELHLNTDLADAYIASATNWNTAYTNRITSLTTSGTSGAATLTGNTLNIPQYQGVLTNPVTGTGTTNTLPKWTSSSALGNSNITDSGSLITLGSNTTISSGSLGIGTTGLSNMSLRISKNIVGGGGTTAISLYQDGVIQSDVTSDARFFDTFASIQNTVFTLSNLRHYRAGSNSFGSATVTNQSGFEASSGLTGATNNYGFRGQIPAGTNRWNIYMDGTANNYMAGSLGIGATNLTGTNLTLGKQISGAVSSNGVVQQGSVLSDVTTQAFGFYNIAQISTGVTLPLYIHYATDASAFSGTVTTQVGFRVGSSLTGGTNNYGFQGAIAAGTNRWNLFMNGTANNYLAGSLLIGSTTDAGFKLDVTGTARVSGNATFSSNVGIGISSPSARLDVSSGALTGALIVGGDFNTSTGARTNATRKYAVLGVPHYTNAEEPMTFAVLNSNASVNEILIGGGQGNLNAATSIEFYTASNNTTVTGTPRIIINSAGNVGIGTSTPGRLLDVSAAGTAYIRASDTTNSVNVDLLAASSGGWIGTQTNHSFQIQTNNTERMRITSGGNVLIGSSTDTGQGHILQVTGAGRFTSSLTASLANFNNLGTGIVYSNGGILTSTNPSDKRLKKDIKNISYGLSDILKLKPVSYNWLNDSINQGIQFGFIAQEVQEIMPDAIKEFGDDIKYLGLEKDAIYVTLVKAIQELSAEINILKNK